MAIIIAAVYRCCGDYRPTDCGGHSAAALKRYGILRSDARAVLRRGAAVIAARPAVRQAADRKQAQRQVSHCLARSAALSVSTPNVPSTSSLLRVLPETPLRVGSGPTAATARVARRMTCCIVACRMSHWRDSRFGSPMEAVREKAVQDAFHLCAAPHVCLAAASQPSDAPWTACCAPINRPAAIASAA